MAIELTDANYRDLTKALNSLARMELLLEKAEQANIPVEQYRQYHDSAKASIEAKKRVFWPDRP